MIHPQLVPHATMLVYILTDAAVEPAVLDGYLRQAIEVSFNRISVDGDTSTNDTVLLLASGASGAVVGAGNAAFAAALTQVCTSLARQIVADGEGITPRCGIAHRGSGHGCRRAQGCQGHRPLAAGQDRLGRRRPQLGTAGGGHRLLRRADRPASASTSASANSPSAATGAAPLEFDEAAAHAYIAQREFSISIQLHQGAGSCIFWTTDLTHEYVSINADYST